MLDDNSRDLSASVAEFESGVQKRNLREWLAGAAVALVFGLYAATSETGTEAVTAIAVVGAALVVCGFIYLYGRTRIAAPGDEDDLRAAYVAELRRQAKLARWAGLWYVAPLMVALVAYGIARGDTVGVAVLAVLVGGGVIWLNLRASIEYDARADRVNESRAT